MAHCPQLRKRGKSSRSGFPDRARVRLERRRHLLRRATEFLFPLPQRRAARRTRGRIPPRPPGRRNNPFCRSEQGQTMDGSFVVLHRSLAHAGTQGVARKICGPRRAWPQRHPLRSHDRGHGPGHWPASPSLEKNGHGKGHPRDLYERQRWVRRGFRLPPAQGIERSSLRRGHSGTYDRSLARSGSSGKALQNPGHQHGLLPHLPRDGRVETEWQTDRWREPPSPLQTNGKTLPENPLLPLPQLCLAHGQPLGRGGTGREMENDP